MSETNQNRLGRNLIVGFALAGTVAYLIMLTGDLAGMNTMPSEENQRIIAIAVTAVLLGGIWIIEGFMSVLKIVLIVTGTVLLGLLLRIVIS